MILRTHPDWHSGPPSLLYNGSFPGVKGPGRGVDHQPPSSAEVKERVELYLYSPSRPSWPVKGCTLPMGPLAALNGIVLRLSQPSVSPFCQFSLVAVLLFHSTPVVK